MRNDHIIDLIESQPLGSLHESDLAAIRSHVQECAGCLSAFQAAQISGSLLKEHAAAPFEASPFFHTRVLATLRERQAINEAWGFSRLWRAAGALASTMAATVATLAILTFVVPETQQVSAVSNVYSAEEVILNQTSQLDDEPDSQLLTIYGGEDEPSR